MLVRWVSISVHGVPLIVSWWISYMGNILLSRPRPTTLNYGAYPSYRDQPFSGGLIMSTTSNLQELDSPVTVPIFLLNGTPTHFPIYTNQSRKEYLKCDLCGRELRLKNRKNTQGFVSHRESKRCKRGKQKEEIHQARAHATTERGRWSSSSCRFELLNSNFSSFKFCIYYYVKSRIYRDPPKECISCSIV